MKVAGFTRLEVAEMLLNIEDLESFGFVPEESMEINLVIDRFSYENDEQFLQRLADSVQMAFYEGSRNLFFERIESGNVKNFQINLN